MELGNAVCEFPYEDGTWRQVGVTPEMICKMADKLCVRVIILHKSSLFHKHTPKGWISDAHMPVIALDIFGDHGFVYDGPVSRRMNAQPLHGPQTFQPVKIKPLNPGSWSSAYRHVTASAAWRRCWPRKRQGHSLATT